MKKRVFGTVLALMVLFTCALNFTMFEASAASNKDTVYNFLINTLKLNSAAACGVMANIEAESGFNPKCSYLDTNGKTSYGICQWNGGRFDNLKKYCSNNGYDYTTINAQLNFLKYELNGSYKSKYTYMLNNIRNTEQGAYDAGYYWASKFEVCASRYWEGRANNAKKYWASYPITNVVTFYRNLDSSDTYKVRENFTTGVKNQKFGYYTSGEGRYNPMNPENVGFGQWTKPGYDLLGWSKDRNATAKTWKTYSDVADSWIRENSDGINLYLVWCPHVYTVSFESDSELLSDTAQVTFGTAYGTLPVPVKKNANFEGWYTADGTLITADSVYTATADQTLFARWSTRTLTGDANGDGSVNMKDLAVLSRYLNNWNVNIDLSVCDINDDGTVNMKDLALFKRLLNN